MDNLTLVQDRTSAVFTETDKTLQFDNAILSGTLCLPVDKTATQVILMLPGNGEVDRNANAMQIQLNIFNELAHSLAAKGIASFRYDKRGCSRSEGKFHETGFFNFVDDAEAWLNTITTYPELKDADVFLLGHSEGALITAHISIDNPRVKGQILLSPFVENMEIAIERQLKQTLDEVGKLTGLKGVIVRLFIKMSGNQLNKQRKLMKRVKNTTRSTIKLKKTLINAKWLREITSIEPKDIYEKNHTPTLAVGGAKDLQSLPTDTEALGRLVKGPVKVQVLANLTHILRTDEEEPSTFNYKSLVDQPIDPRISELVVEFLTNYR